MFYNLNEAAKILKISRRTLNRKLAKTNFPLRYFNGGKPLIYAYDLISFVLFGFFYDECDSKQREMVRQTKVDYE